MMAMGSEREELVAAWTAAGAFRFDDLFASRPLLRLAKALIAYHEAARPELRARILTEPDQVARCILDDVEVTVDGLKAVAARLLEAEEELWQRREAKATS